MDNMEEKLGSILGNPAMMQQIMSIAQSLGQSQPEPPKEETPALPDIDPGMISKVMAMAGQTNIDPNQQQLLKALRPYLTHQRIERLEKAMRAAKLANLASGFLGR
ncbi:MAG: hypothetical protein IKJ99_01490 [Oscillospiraceae bacterium]|nr:hypothetical protein [Oscillospiraceae bacterium]